MDRLSTTVEEYDRERVGLDPWWRRIRPLLYVRIDGRRCNGHPGCMGMIDDAHPLPEWAKANARHTIRMERECCRRGEQLDVLLDRLVRDA